MYGYNLLRCTILRRIFEFGKDYLRQCSKYIGKSPINWDIRIKGLLYDVDSPATPTKPFRNLSTHLRRLTLFKAVDNSTVGEIPSRFIAAQFVALL